MKEPLPEKTSAALLALGGLALQFATVKRFTLLADGKTFESDTDHTVMLGLIACALASACDSTLDIGKIAQFALVHDLVEAYAGDTNTFGLTDESVWRDKEAREAAALLRVKSEFDETLPWISSTIEEYESLASPEARFIKTMDKTLPKVTRFFNNGAGQTSPEEFMEHCSRQLDTIRKSYAKDQETALSFNEYTTDKVFKLLQRKHGSETT